jgi:AcrR family transcriptional regulator
MDPVPSRQTRKRLATRQKISDAATRLFIERGFDGVTVDEIAEAADVSRMTVFNHFSRKEDMFFDLDQGGREDLLTALQRRDRGVPPVEALRLFAHQAVAEQRPYARFFEAGSDRFMATLQASEALKSRARAIRDELSDLLTAALERCASGPLSDPAAHLAASLLLATWTVALTEAHRAYDQSKNAEKANQVFLRLVDQGTKGVQAALEGTPYV